MRGTPPERWTLAERTFRVRTTGQIERQFATNFIEMTVVEPDFFRTAFI
jgi:hypothetical protein